MIVNNTYFKKTSQELYYKKTNKVEWDFTKIYPVNEEDKNINIISGASSVERPVLTYNNITNEFLFTVVVNNVHLIELFIKYLPESFLREAIVYEPFTLPTTTPYTNQELALTATSTIPFTYQVVANNNPISFGITDSSFDWITVSNTGTFTGTPPISGTFFVPFTISNNYGPIYYSLNITVSS
jgi:hypothetical protein